jgi:hypothetical protein
MNKQNHLHFILAVLLATLFGCLAAFPGSGASASASPRRMEKESLDAASDIVKAYTLPFRILDEAESAVNRSAQLVFGTNFDHPDRLSSTGTYLVVNGHQVYHSSPNDRLNIIVSEGTRTIQTMFGSDGLTRAEPWAAPGTYLVSHLVSTSEILDLMVYRYAIGGSDFLDVSGTLKVDGQEYRVSLSRHSLRIPSPGQADGQAARETTLRGLILSGDLTLQVNESITILAEGRIEISRRTTNSRWTRGRDEYQFINAWVKTRLRDREPTGYGEAWSAAGPLIRNGLPYGKLKLRDNATQLELVIAAPGAEILLEAWEFQHP